LNSHAPTTRSASSSRRTIRSAAAASRFGSVVFGLPALRVMMVML